jgi:hypothetical protein
MEIVWLIVSAAALLNLGWGWADWRTEVSSAQIPKWRRIIATVGLSAVTMQAIEVLALWTCRNFHAVGYYTYLLIWWHWLLMVVHVSPIPIRADLLVAIPCVLIGKSNSRRALIISSVSLALCWGFVFRI